MEKILSKLMERCLSLMAAFQKLISQQLALQAIHCCIIHSECNSLHINNLTQRKILSEGIDELSIKRVVDKELQRKKIRDTNKGKELQAQIDILKMLMHDRYLD